MTQRRTTRLRFSTDSLPPKRRFEAWREGFVRRHMNMDFIDRCAGGLRFMVDLIPLGPVTLGSIRGTPSIFIRAPAGLDDALFMVISRSGRFSAVQRADRFDLAAGEAAVFDNRFHAELHYLGEGEAWSVSIPRMALRHLVRGIEQPIERHIPALHPMLRLLTGYLEALFALDEIADPELAGMHIADLVASALCARRTGGEPNDEAGAHDARLRAVLDAIARNVGDPDLDPRGLANRLGISVRYLHRVLKDSGQTFSEHLNARRVGRAYRLLRDPRLAHLKISDIALEAGFSDLTHFNRSFRRRYGDTPSAVRIAAARRDNEGRPA
ncbi:MAG TPA: helix-turn-helix domain-containing protein [Xanthobacteraceae bacterium]